MHASEDIKGIRHGNSSSFVSWFTTDPRCLLLVGNMHSTLSHGNRRNFSPPRDFKCCCNPFSCLCVSSTLMKRPRPIDIVHWPNGCSQLPRLICRYFHLNRRIRASYSVAQRPVNVNIFPIGENIPIYACHWNCRTVSKCCDLCEQFLKIQQVIKKLLVYFCASYKNQLNQFWNTLNFHFIYYSVRWAYS
jgi:hypothetical protein